MPRNVGDRSQIAPLSFAFETIAGNERMNIIMNHELVHVATMDQAARSDRFFRRLFGGKVTPVAEQPESILYFFLTTPRVAAPRWYHEGIAVFVDTWMAGGLGRAQGGYDEMVFRSMVRDGTPFYDPLGLVSEGTKIDFQVEVNSYLYGTRFMTWLARRYSPEQADRVGVAPRRQPRATTPRSSGRSSARRSSRRGPTGSRTSTSSSSATSTRSARIRSRRTATSRRARSARCRARTTIRPTGRSTRAFNYPGVLSHVGAIATEDAARIEKLVDIKGPSIYTVTSLAYDPGAQTLFYTTDNNAYRDLMSVDPATHRTQMLLKDARIGDLAFNRADRSLWGIRHLNGICTLVRIPPPYRDWQRVVIVAVRHGRLRPRRLARRLAPGGVVRRDQRQAGGARLSTDGGARAGDTTPVARFDFGTAVPNGFVFSPDGRYLYGSSYYTGVSNIFRYDLAGDRSSMRSPTPRPDSSGRSRSAATSLIVFRYSGAGLRARRASRRGRSRTSAPITFLGERLAEEHPVVKSWNVGSPAAIAVRRCRSTPRAYRLAGGLHRESVYPIVQGYKDDAGRRATASTSRIRCSSIARSLAACLLVRAAQLPASERLHLDADYQRYDWRGARRAGTAPTSTICSARRKTGRKGYVRRGGHKNTLIFDEPRRLELDVDGTHRRQSRSAARVSERRRGRRPARARSRRSCSYSDVRNSLGYVDDESGRRWSAVVQGRVRRRHDGAARSTGPTIDGVAPADRPLVDLARAAPPASRRATATLPFANFFFGGFGNN